MTACRSHRAAATPTSDAVERRTVDDGAAGKSVRSVTTARRQNETRSDHPNHAKQPGAVMKCPRCDGLLDERERQGVTVDVCPGCRGVWLDRGELEKMLAFAKRELEEERAYYNAAPPVAPAGRDYDREPPSSDDRRRARHAQGQHPNDPRYGYRKKGWLENLGDIFD